MFLDTCIRVKIIKYFYLFLLENVYEHNRLFIYRLGFLWWFYSFLVS